MSKPLVSLCMMVKNEERTLRQCLKSIVGIADEIIIADTGSTDGTIDIIKEFTPNYLTYEWNDDFAAARNFVASRATGTYVCRWDADWILRSGDMEKILTIKQKKFYNQDEVHFNWINEYNEDTLAPISTVPHMFLYKRELFEWYCAVPAHDMTRPIKEGYTPTIITDPSIWVYHQKEPEHKAHRYEQTHKLIENNLATMDPKHPNYPSNLQFYLSSCLFLGKYPEALKTVTRLLKLLTPKNELFNWLLEQHIVILLQLGYVSSAYDLSQKYYQKYPSHNTLLAHADTAALVDPDAASSLYQDYLNYHFSNENLDINYERYIIHPRLMHGTLTASVQDLEYVKTYSRKRNTQTKAAQIIQKLTR